MIIMRLRCRAAVGLTLAAARASACNSPPADVPATVAASAADEPEDLSPGEEILDKFLESLATQPIRFDTPKTDLQPAAPGATSDPAVTFQARHRGDSWVCIVNLLTPIEEVHIALLTIKDDETVIFNSGLRVDTARSGKRRFLYFEVAERHVAQTTLSLGVDRDDGAHLYVLELDAFRESVAEYNRQFDEKRRRAASEIEIDP